MRYKYLTIILLLYSYGLSAQTLVLRPDSTLSTQVELSEIVITASKNETKLKELPASVSVIPMKSITANEITSLSQLGTLSPNFVMPEYGSKLTSPVYIRGIGSRINNPSIGLYVDNVPYFEKSAFEFDFFDLERIEILRGPQGTLYGRNSMGGLINIVTRSPLNYQGANLSVSAATYGSYRLRGGGYMKLNDKLAVSLSGNYLHNDGFYENKFLNQKVDKLNSFGFRNKIVYQASGKFTVENVASIDNSKQGGYPYALYNVETQTDGDVSYNQPSSYDRLMFSDALNFKYTAANWELTNTVSYQYIDDIQKIDQDFTPDSLYFIKQLQTQQMVANELMVKSRGNSRYSWLFGAFGFMQGSESDVDVNTYKIKLWYLKTYDADVTGVAFFHQSTFKVTDNLSVTGGLRFDYETSGLHYKYRSTKANIELPRTDTIYPDMKDHIFLPKLALNYKFNHVSVYASYTWGYKPGGFNTTFERPEDLKFKNEKSNNYEVGAKASLFSLLYADLALFYTKLKDQQIYRTTLSGRGAYLENAGVSENKGIEVTLKSSPVRGFEAMVAYGYTYSKILKYEKDAVTNYNNNFTQYIPRHTLAIQATQTLLFNKSSFIDQIKLNVLYNQNGLLYWDLENNLNKRAYRLIETPYRTLSAKVSFIKGNVQFDIWGKNLLNADYHSFLFEALGNTYIQKGKPMQLGVNVLVKF
ncbi:MAG TPA: TonB-dependent receptor [Bacteroidales bacterium]|nr:TonB-dependent receptor [Bacteroidales bacterium]